MSRGLVVIIGSGELGPSMVATHRAMFEQVGANTVTVLDSPYGFQENADDLTERISTHFVKAFGVKVRVASLRKPDAGDDEREATLSAIRGAEVVFAGPGSPSYALRVWADLDLREALRGVVDRGGAVVMASAAALTLGVKTIPVYEIYKVGDDPHWLDGLDLLSEMGLKAAVVPHWNNREGGFHDTSHCFIGEARFLRMVAELGADVGVLGVDEHTSITLDPDAGEMRVLGIGQGHLNGHPITGTHPLSLGNSMHPLEPTPQPRLDQQIIDHPHSETDDSDVASALIDLLVEIRTRARASMDFAESDRIRDELAMLNIELRDSSEGTSWRRQEV